MEGEVVTRQFLAQALQDLERRVTQHMENSELKLEASIAGAQTKTLYWMVGIFLAAIAVVGTSIGVYTMIVLSSRL